MTGTLRLVSGLVADSPPAVKCEPPRWWLCTPLVMLALVSPRAAHADQLEGAGHLLAAIELLIPDVRFERSFTESSNRWVVSFPVAIHGGHVALGAAGLVFNHVAEVQYQVTSSALRGLLGERMLFHSSERRDALMPFVEASALVGQDGSGAVLGGGISWGDRTAGVTMGLVVRYVLTGDERRGDVALDVQIPLNAP